MSTDTLLLTGNAKWTGFIKKRKKRFQSEAFTTTHPSYLDELNVLLLTQKYIFFKLKFTLDKKKWNRHYKKRQFHQPACSSYLWLISTNVWPGFKKWFL